VNGVEHKYETFNGKELDESLGLNVIEMDFRQYDPALGRFNVVDPMAEQRDWLSPYNFAQNNPIIRVDPTGLLDDFVFDEAGDFVRIDKNDKPDKLVVENSKTGDRKNYSFVDSKQDTQDIRDGVINKVLFVTESDVKDMLTSQGAFDPDNKDSWSNFYKESKGGQDFDYSYSVIPSKYGKDGASFNPLKNPSSVLFLAEGDYMAHNHMNFGNYLWAASGFTLGFSYSTLQMAAHGNSLVNSKSNGYPAQWDSKDDQRSIIKGAYYADKNGFRKTLQQAVDTQNKKNKR
jgi:RHS repeat-associated protein